MALRVWLVSIQHSLCTCDVPAAGPGSRKTVVSENRQKPLSSWGWHSDGCQQAARGPAFTTLTRRPLYHRPSGAGPRLGLRGRAFGGRKSWVQTSNPREMGWPLRPPFTPDMWQRAGQGTISKPGPCVCVHTRARTPRARARAARRQGRARQALSPAAPLCFDSSQDPTAKRFPFCCICFRSLESE